MKEPNNVQAFLDTLRAYSFRYKNPADEPTETPNGGRYLGVMAQDVEKTPYGKQIVKEDEEGKKYLETAPLMSALAASIANLNERVKAVETPGKKKDG